MLAAWCRVTVALRQLEKELLVVTGGEDAFPVLQRSGCAGSRWGLAQWGTSHLLSCRKKGSGAVTAPVVFFFLAGASQGSHAWSGCSFLARMLVPGVNG